MRLISRLIPWLGAGILLILVVACSGQSAERPTATVSTAERDAQLTQKLLEMQEQITNLEQQLAEMQADQTRQINRATQMGQNLSNQLAQMRQTLNAPAPAPADAPGPAIVPPAGDQPLAPAPAVDAAGDSVNVFLRFILVIILLCAIFFMVKLFMGRWNEEEEDEEEEEDFEYTTEEGSVRLSPEVQAEARQYEESAEDMEFREPRDTGEESPDRP
ncbi:MAG TPA: hypothetical protein PK847_13490 [Candidatus Sumerlaeota bacterium]|nr:hypothetical protein [Candidatus Sumerlaeota bacterium]HOR29160.1 hypothetical protein [Candidatus Sumerlaeota bacterium]